MMAKFEEGRFNNQFAGINHWSVQIEKGTLLLQSIWLEKRGSNPGSGANSKKRETGISCNRSYICEIVLSFFHEVW